MTHGAKDLRREWAALAQSPQRAAFLERLKEQRGPEDDHAEGDRVRIGIFSSTTWRPIVTSLEGELWIENLKPTIELYEYEALSREIATGDSRFDLAVLAIDDRESYGSLYEDDSTAASNALLASILSRVDRLSERSSQVVVTLPTIQVRAPHGLGRGSSGRSHSAQVRRFVTQLEDALAERAGVIPLDLDSVLFSLGSSRAFDPRLWELGRIRYSADGFAAIARSIAPVALAGAGRGIKAIVLDLDNTLWGGVIGEDGLSGIELGGDYPGSCYREFQRELARFQRAGVLLAVASKNNEADALEAIEQHPEMVLRGSQFAHREIHWEPKSVSVGRILEAFNIGPDAVLFIDDNPREREAVARAHPQLRIFDFPDDPLDLVPRLCQIPWPVFAGISPEDSRRHELQEQQAARSVARSEARSAGENSDAYLHSLGITLEFRVDEPADVKRVAQLHQKTNQFNVRPIRLGEADIQRRVEDRDTRVVTVRYRDQFGDAGLVGCAVVRACPDPGQPSEVETLLLSCRVIGLGVEHALLDRITADGPVRVPFRVTAKNAPAREFLASVAGGIGDVPVGQEGEIVVTSTETPAWISLQEPRKATSSCAAK